MQIQNVSTKILFIALSIYLSNDTEKYENILTRRDRIHFLVNVKIYIEVYGACDIVDILKFGTSLCTIRVAKLTRSIHNKSDLERLVNTLTISSLCSN